MAIVLLLEPDVLLADCYRLALDRAGHEVHVCMTAQTAVSMADEARPDIVILELCLVRHNGLEFLYEFRSYTDWLHIPIIVLSRMPPSEFAESWQLLNSELGICEYLYKPHTSLHNLTQAVRRLVTPTPA